MGKLSRQKGKRGEREVVKILRANGYPLARRRAMQSRGGHEGADIDGVPGLHVEVSLGRENPRKKLEQASADALAVNAGDVPIAVTRPDGGEWMVSMDLGDFLAMNRWVVR